MEKTCKLLLYKNKIALRETRSHKTLNLRYNSFAMINARFLGGMSYFITHERSTPYITLLSIYISSTNFE